MARILVSMPDEFLNSIDKMANSELRSRSELIREALRSYVKKANTPKTTAGAQKNAKILEDLLG